MPLSRQSVAALLSDLFHGLAIQSAPFDVAILIALLAPLLKQPGPIPRGPDRQSLGDPLRPT